MRNQMSLYMIHKIHHHHDNDEHRSAAKVKRHPRTFGKRLGKQADHHHVERTKQCEACEHRINVSGCVTAGTNTWNKTSRAFEIVCHLARVVHQGRVKEAKTGNQKGE